jgi:hypothetical protein
MTDDRQTSPRKPPNMRTALVLLSIAVLFFAGVIAKRVLFG